MAKRLMSLYGSYGNDRDGRLTNIPLMYNSSRPKQYGQGRLPTYSGHAVGDGRKPYHAKIGIAVHPRTGRLYGAGNKLFEPLIGSGRRRRRQYGGADLGSDVHISAGVAGENENEVTQYTPVKKKLMKLPDNSRAMFPLFQDYKAGQLDKSKPLLLLRDRGIFGISSPGYVQ